MIPAGKGIMDYFIVAVVFVSALFGILFGLYIGLSMQNLFYRRQTKKFKKESDKESKLLYPTESRSTGRKKRSLWFLEKMMKNIEEKAKDLDNETELMTDTEASNNPKGKIGNAENLRKNSFLKSLFKSCKKEKQPSSLSRLNIDPESYISERCNDYGTDIKETASKGLETQDESYDVTLQQKKKEKKKQESSLARLHEVTKAQQEEERHKEQKKIEEQEEGKETTQVKIQEPRPVKNQEEKEFVQEVPEEIEEPIPPFMDEPEMPEPMEIEEPPELDL